MQRIWICRQFLGHKADLNNWAHAILQQAIVDLVDIGKVVAWYAVFVLVIYPKLIMKNAVKTDIVEVGNLLERSKILAIALAESKRGTT